MHSPMHTRHQHTPQCSGKFSQFLIENWSDTSWQEYQVRGHSSITSSKRWVGGLAKWWCLMTRWVGGSGLMMTWSKNIQGKKTFQVTDFFSGKMNQNYYVACSFFFNKNKPCLILALFIKERKKILIGGWVWGNDDVIIKVGIGNDDVWW